MEKYAQYFKGNEILPIPELVQELEPRILSLVISDIKTKKLVGVKKETFEELLRKAGIPCQYFCRKSFATWNVLLPTEEQAAKTARTNIMTKNFRLQPEYKGTRRLRVTISNVPAHLTGEVLASYLSAFGEVEEFNLLRSPAGTAYGDYTFRLCLTRDGFKAIPETLISGDRQMIVMVEGRRPRCWECKQVGHIVKFCPQKAEGSTAAATTTTTTTDAAATTTPKQIEGPSQAQQTKQQNNQEGWTEVTRKKKGSPKQGQTSTISPLPPKPSHRNREASDQGADPPKSTSITSTNITSTSISRISINNTSISSDNSSSKTKKEKTGTSREETAGKGLPKKYVQDHPALRTH